MKYLLFGMFAWFFGLKLYEKINNIKDPTTGILMWIAWCALVIVLEIEYGTRKNQLK